METATMHRTNIELDEKLVAEAMKLSKKKTKKELVNFALEELVRKYNRKKILELKERSNTEKFKEMEVTQF